MVLYSYCQYTLSLPIYRKSRRTGNGSNLNNLSMYGPEGWAYWGQSPKQVLNEPLGCVGTGTASLASRYCRKGNVCDQFFTKFNDTEWVHNSEPERRWVTSLLYV